jgi:hypothetical protein
MPDAQDSGVGAPANTKPTDQAGLPAEHSGTRKRSSRSKKITNVAELIAYIYARKGKPVTLRPKVIKVVCQSPTLDPPAFNELLLLARNDLRLAVPVQLLLATLSISHTALRASLREFAGAVLREHPAFSSQQMNAALRNLPEAPDLERSLRLISSAEFLRRQPLPDKIKRKKRDLTALRVNATYSLALWFAETRGLKPEDMVEALFLSIWEPDGDQARDALRQFRLLTANHDVEAVGAACSIFKQRADNMSAAAARAQRGEAEALEESQKLTASVSKLGAELSNRQAEIAALETQMENQKQDYENKLAHERDDRENLRARVLRRLKDDVKLLDEGVHALQRDPPKVRIMEDHAERTLDALRKEIHHLEAEK